MTTAISNPGSPRRWWLPARHRPWRAMPGTPFQQPRPRIRFSAWPSLPVDYHHAYTEDDRPHRERAGHKQQRKGAATAIPIASEAPPAIAIGTASPANVSAAATLLPGLLATERCRHAEQNRGTDRHGNRPPSTPLDDQKRDRPGYQADDERACEPANRLSAKLSSRTSAAQPRSTEAGSCARKPATALMVSNNPATDGPATPGPSPAAVKAVRRRHALRQQSRHRSHALTRSSNL